MSTSTALRSLPRYLSKGPHRSPARGTCLMEAVAWFAGEPHSDTPACVSPLLVKTGISLNDRLSAEQRQRLIPLIPLLVGTGGHPDTAEDDKVRSCIAADWIIRYYAATWFQAVGWSGLVLELTTLPRLDGARAARAVGAITPRLIEEASAQLRGSHLWNITTTSEGIAQSGVFSLLRAATWFPKNVSSGVVDVFYAANRAAFHLHPDLADQVIADITAQALKCYARMIRLEEMP